MMEKLSVDERGELLEPLFANGWLLHDEKDALIKNFEFKNFTDAFGWMIRIAIWAERRNHHPDWSNVYSRVQVTLVTHEVDCLSNLDLELAHEMDVIFEDIQLKRLPNWEPLEQCMCIAKL